MHSSDTLEETHRHYSFIAVLAMMSLFLLITISITGLLLGFCRKKSGTYSGSDGKMDGNSQFELDDIDIGTDTMICKDDPHGVCYFHLSDDDFDDDDDDDDDDNANDKQCTKAERRRDKKWKRLRNRGYYYHLYNNNDDDDDSCDEKEHGGNCNNALGDRGFNSTEPESANSHPPKRSTTFPQLHNVLTSCIRGHNPHSEYQTLKHSSTKCSNISSDTQDFSTTSSTDVSKSPHIPSSSSPETRSINSHQQQQQHIHASVQIRNFNSSSGVTACSPGGKSIRSRQKQNRQRQARNQRQPLHHYNKLRPNHMQQYSSLSYHRHTKLHHAIKHNFRPTQKRIPVTWPEGGGGFLYKSHSIHAIPCSNSSESQSAGALDNSQCQVKIKVERVHYDGDDDDDKDTPSEKLLIQNL